MKAKIHTAVIILTLFNCNLSFSQNLSYQDLKYLLEHNIEDADNYLSRKNFLYHRTEEPTASNCKTMFWSFDRNTNNNRAVAFLSKYCFEANTGFVWYQVGDRKTFDNIKAYCKASGFKQTTTGTDKLGSLCTALEAEKYKIEFCSRLNTGTNKNVYTITLSTKPPPIKVATGNRIQANQKCLLKGILKRELFYGAPNFGEDTASDKKEYSYILILQKPILFFDDELGSGEWETISKIHILEVDDNIDLSRFINKKVSIICTLVTAHTGHHHAPAITWELYDIKLTQ